MVHLLVESSEIRSLSALHCILELPSSDIVNFLRRCFLSRRLDVSRFNFNVAVASWDSMSGGKTPWRRFVGLGRTNTRFTDRFHARVRCGRRQECMML